MTAAAESKLLAEFAGFRVDRFRRRLMTLDGTPVPVSSRAFDALLVLLDKPGEVVTKQELISAVWPTTVVEENNLTQAVSALRKALGDTQERPQIILTVPGRGYSLIAAVRTVEDEAPAAPPPVPATARSAQPSRAWQRMGLGLAAIALVGAVLVWMRPADRESAASAAAPTDAPASVPTSVAVLPFTVVGAEPQDDDGFALGLHDEVVTQLSRISGLRVIARNAVLRYRGDTRPVTTIARELNVGAVLEGTVRTAGRQLRINLQLSDPATQVMLWSNGYDASLDDLGTLFTAQADIANNVAKALAVELLPQELELAARTPTDSAQAYRHYLGALAALAANDFGSALAELEQTVALDPEFVEAWYRLANVSNIMVAIPVTSPREQLDRALYAASQAIALDPDSVNAHSVMGSILYARGDFARAERELDEAERLRSARTMADDPLRDDRIMMSLALGNFASARERSAELLAHNPIHLIAISYLMLAEEYSGNHVAAMQQYARGKALMPTWWGENPGLWIALGRRDTAHLAGAVRDFRDFPLRNVLELYDDPAAAIAELESMRTRLASLTPAQQLNAAFFAAYFSREELAMDFLEAGLRANSASLYVIWLPVLSEVRRAERFKAFLRERGVVDYWEEHGWPDVCAPSAETFSCR